MIGSIIILVLAATIVIIFAVRHRVPSISETELDRRLAALRPADAFESDDERTRREASLAAILGEDKLNKDTTVVDLPEMDHKPEPGDPVDWHHYRVNNLAASMILLLAGVGSMLAYSNVATVGPFIGLVGALGVLVAKEMIMLLPQAEKLRAEARTKYPEMSRLKQIHYVLVCLRNPPGANGMAREPGRRR